MKELVAEGLVLVLAVPAQPMRPLNAMDAMGEACGCVDSGVPDLASNPRQMKGFGQ